MPFTPRTDWADTLAGGTPILAAELIRIEQGIFANEFRAGFEAAMPAASASGRLLYTTDTQALWRDTGTSWSELVLRYISVDAVTTSVGGAGDVRGYTTSPVLKLGRAEGNESAPTATGANDLGGVAFTGHNGTDWVTSASIMATAPNGWSSNTQPARLVFSVRKSTDAESGSDFFEAARLTGYGRLGIANTTPTARVHIGDGTGSLADNPASPPFSVAAGMGLKVEVDTIAGTPAPDLIQANLKLVAGTTAGTCAAFTGQVDVNDTSGGVAAGIVGHAKAAAGSTKVPIGGAFRMTNAATAVEGIALQAELINNSGAVGGNVFTVITTGTTDVKNGIFMQGSGAAAQYQRGIFMSSVANEAPLNDFIYCGSHIAGNPFPGTTPIFRVGLDGTIETKGSLTATNTTGLGYIDLAEQSVEPAAPAADHLRMFFRASGGSTQVCFKGAAGNVYNLATYAP